MNVYKMLDSGDTIAAISTPLGEGGISVIRLSGIGAFEVADRVFLGRTKLGEALSHSAHFGRIVDEAGNLVDEVVAVTFRAPASYTCEDVVELSCHGGYLVTQRVLERVLGAGARLAEPGEFTRRAFLNGRLDLSQAEAVADLIQSQSDAAYRSSVRQLSGELSRKIRGLRDDLLNLASLLELELDFTEEDVEFADKKILQARLESAVMTVDELLLSYSLGRVYREGVRITIAGRPNAGKSSLLNAVLGDTRAIVSEIPGTTRDTISESVSIKGVLFRLTDTAGLRETMDKIEREGVDRARKEAEEADIVLLVIDLMEGDYNGTEPIYSELEEICSKGGVKVVRVWNKVDLYQGEAPRMAVDGHNFYVSAIRGDGIDSLKEGLFNMVLGKDLGESSVVVTNARHRSALEKARKNLAFALETLESGKSGEFVALDLRSGLNALGEITGEVTTEDILNNIFSRFCVGK